MKPILNLSRSLLVEMIFLTARHGNQEDFQQHLQVLKEMIPSKDVLMDTCAFDQNGRSLILDAIHGDNVVIFDDTLALNRLRVNSFIELDSDDSESDASGGEDESVGENGLKHFSGRPRRHSSSDDEDDMLPLCEKLMRKANHQGEPLPRRYSLGTKLLRYAISKSATSIVEHLIRSHGVRDEISDGFQSALHLAVEGGHENLIDLLLIEGGSRIDARDHHQATPLILAVKHNHIRIAKKLINSFGADLSLTDARNRNAVSYAVQNDSMELLMLIAERCGEMDCFRRFLLVPEKNSLNTALHFCASQSVLMFFVFDCSLDMNEPANINGRTPMQLYNSLMIRDEK